jgi:alpha-glucosidase (family GH31 glycosyl hydrolase)
MANLTLNGSPCNAYGKDYTNLILSVYYDTETRLHVTIGDADSQQYRIPGSLVTVPQPSDTIGEVDYSFNYNESPFEFWISRRDGDILFDTRGYKLVFETQYIELITNMEDDYNIYGLGEVIHSLRLHKNFTRTMWAKYLTLYVLLIVVTKPIQLMGTFMVHIPSTSNISIRRDLTDAITRLMLSISEIRTEWIYCYKTPLYNIVPSAEFLTCTSIQGHRRKMSFDSMSHLLVYRRCINIGPLAFISVVGDTTISQSCKMWLTIIRTSTFLSKPFGLT